MKMLEAASLWAPHRGHVQHFVRSVDEVGVSVAVLCRRCLVPLTCCSQVALPDSIMAQRRNATSPRWSGEGGVGGAAATEALRKGDTQG